MSLEIGVHDYIRGHLPEGDALAVDALESLVRGHSIFRSGGQALHAVSVEANDTCARLFPVPRAM
jgi:hypothetical protein